MGLVGNGVVGGGLLARQLFREAFRKGRAAWGSISAGAGGVWGSGYGHSGEIKTSRRAFSVKLSELGRSRAASCGLAVWVGHAAGPAWVTVPRAHESGMLGHGPRRATPFI